MTNLTSKIGTGLVKEQEQRGNERNTVKKGSLSLQLIKKAYFIYSKRPNSESL